MVAAVTMIEDEIDDVVRRHGTLLRKGLNLSHVPTVNEVLKRDLPSPSQTSGRIFSSLKLESLYLLLLFELQ